MFAVIEKDKDGAQRIVGGSRYYMNAYDFAESLNEDMADSGSVYFVAEVPDAPKG